MADIDHGLEQLRARHGSLSTGSLKARPGRGRNLTSRGGDSGETLGLTAVESVHSGLVASLEADCRNYREEIKMLQVKLRQMPAKAPPPVDEAPQRNVAKMHAAQVQKLTEELATVRKETEQDAKKLAEERDGLLRSTAELQQALRAARADRTRVGEAEAAAEEAVAELVRARGEWADEREALQARLQSSAGQGQEATAELARQLEAARHEAAVLRAEAQQQQQTHREELAQQLRLAEALRAQAAEAARERDAAAAGSSVEAEAATKAAAAAKAAAARLEEAERESARLREELARVREAAERAEAERASLAKKAAGAGEKGRKASSDAAGLKEQLARTTEQLKELKTKLVLQQEAEQSLAQSAAKDAARCTRNLERLERQATLDEQTIAELRAKSRQLAEEREAERGALTTQVQKLHEQLHEQQNNGAAAAAAAAAAAPPLPPTAVPLVKRASTPSLGARGADNAPLSNSNFAKMMSMQQEINQLKAHIEGLNANMARQQRAARR